MNEQPAPRGDGLAAAFWSLANPGRFMQYSAAMLPWLAAVTAALMAYGLYKGIFVAPADYQQGESMRIMYIHVPAAWMAMGVYSMMTLSALGTLVWRHPLADVSQKAAAPIGATFTALCLMTGSLWGKPTWGTWWEWDARMTSVLVLLLIYFGIIALWRAIDEPLRAARAVAIMTLVGAVNLPIIKFSVDWWNTLHQPASVFRRGGPTIHPAMLEPLLVMGLAFALLFGCLQIVRMQAEIINRRADRLALRQATGEA
jgi:heme exporter protein C